MCVGPDAQNLHRVEIDTLNVEDLTLQFYSTVLHLRGPEVVPQPRINNGDVLCWNGEIFGGIPVSLMNQTLRL